MLFIQYVYGAIQGFPQFFPFHCCYFNLIPNTDLIHNWIAKVGFNSATADGFTVLCLLLYLCKFNWFVLPPDLVLLLFWFDFGSLIYSWPVPWPHSTSTLVSEESSFLRDH